MQGGLKAKRLSQLVASLGGNSARKGLGEADRLVRLRDLLLGANKGVAVAFKVKTSVLLYDGFRCFRGGNRNTMTVGFEGWSVRALRIAS